MFRDVAGNENAKSALREMVLLPAVRPDIFVGLRSPPKAAVDITLTRRDEKEFSFSLFH